MTEGRDPREAFETLLRPLLPLAFRYAARLAGDRELAMDLVQDASVAAFRAFAQYGEGTNFKAWYLRILTNRYFRTRREARLPVVAMDDAPELFLYRQARRMGVLQEADPVALVMGRIDGDAACEALGRLPDEYRTVATLHFLGETTYEECAQTLDIPLGTVRSRLHRARRMLQAALWRIAVERGYVKEETP